MELFLPTLNCRCYTSPVRREMDQLKSVVLIDEQETKLHSRDEYYSVFNNMMEQCKEYKEYLKKYAVVSHGDCPTWYLQRK